MTDAHNVLRFRTTDCTKIQENQFIDFRLLTTKKEKPRFFLLCQRSQRATGAFFVDSF